MRGVADDQAAVGEHAVEDGIVHVGIVGGSGICRIHSQIGGDENGAGAAAKIDGIVKGDHISRAGGAEEEFVAASDKA